MARHATWIRRPEDPRTLRGWVLRHDSYVARGYRKTLALVALIAIFVFGLSFASPFPVPLFVALAGVVATVAYAKPGARERATMPTLGEHEVFPVTLDLRGPGGGLIGRERGWIAFVDGWLVYEGLRTAFAVDAPSLERARREMWEVRLDLPGGGRARLILLTDALQTERPATWGDHKRLSAAFEAWQRHPPTMGEPIMPPHEPHPALLVDRLRLDLVFTAGAGIVLLTGLIVWETWMLVFGAIGFTVGTGLYRHAYRRLERRLLTYDVRASVDP